MSTTNQFTYKEDMVIHQGADFTYVISVSDRNGNALDLSNISAAYAQMKDSYLNTVGTSFDVAITNAASGRIQLGISGSDTIDLYPGMKLYDIVGITTTNLTIVLCSGKITLLPLMTRL